MKLYFARGACSMAPHIILREGGFSFELERVDLATHQTAGGEDYRRINPKGYVPALRLDDGSLLTEVAVVLQYLADQKPDAGLAPPYGGMPRYRVMEWLNYIATEVHKTFGPFFNPKLAPEARDSQMALLARRFDYLSEALATQHFLVGDTFGIADAYLFTVLSWSNYLKIDLAPWPVLQDYLARVAARPAVRDAMKAEGLINS